MPETMKQIAEVTREFPPTVQQIAAEEGQQFPNDIDQILFDRNDVRISNTKAIVEELLDIAQDMQMQGISETNHQTPERVHQTPETAELIAHDVQQIHEMPETIKQIAEVTREFPPTVQQIAAEEGQQFPNDIGNLGTVIFRFKKLPFPFQKILNSVLACQKMEIPFPYRLCTHGKVTILFTHPAEITQVNARAGQNLDLSLYQQRRRMRSNRIYAGTKNILTHITNMNTSLPFTFLALFHS
ncbi:uncharacterized protein LOC121428945 [Lytechinus variegatus]|uniref:uncharacterized protein LOC121428945 n=1 Tax=Lytechinus variegatus TaxID=7654 RepID=UPI001BB1BA44|nr:uncharacterized protein LOC121428945 [Lytechinus variegatus]